MFTRVPLALGLVLAATMIAAACEPPFPPSPDEPLLKPHKPKPAAPFPQVGTVVALDGKEEMIEYTVVVPVVVRETIGVWSNLREPGDGSKIRELGWKTVTVYRWQYKQITRKSKIDRLKFSDATGKPIPTLDAWKRLEIGTTFFVSADGAPVSAEHRKLIAPDALVVIDYDNVLMERILQELELSAIDQVPEKPLPNPGPWPKPPKLPRPGPQPLPEPR